MIEREEIFSVRAGVLEIFRFSEIFSVRNFERLRGKIEREVFWGKKTKQI